MALPSNEGTTPRKSVLSGICRCCNQSYSRRNLFDLFGKKASSENLVETICRITEGDVNIKHDDNLPSKICHSCYSIVTSLNRKANDFRNRCKLSEKTQRDSYVRSKRQRNEPPSSPTASSAVTASTYRSPTVSSPKHKARKTGEVRTKSVRRNLMFLRPRQSDGQGSQSPHDIQKRTLPESLLSTSSTKGKSQTSKSPENVVGGPESIDILKSSGIRQTSTVDVDMLSDADVTRLIDIIVTALPKEVAKIVMDIPKLRTAVKNVVLQEVDIQCKALCARTKNPSVLHMSKKDNEEIHSFSWFSILHELKTRAPDVLDFIRTVAAPTVQEDGRQVAPICMTYALMMHTRWTELSLCQKIVAVILGLGHATEKTFQRLLAIGVCQSRMSYSRIMDDIGGGLVTKLRSWVADGKDIRVVFDNFDFRILANILLQNHRNSDMHWIAHYATYDRFVTKELDDTKPLLADVKSLENVSYLLNPEEMDKMKKEFTVLVGRVLVKFFPCMKPISRVIPQHIEHKFSEEMAKKSEIVMLPVVPYNQNKLSDVCQYLEWLQNLMFTVHRQGSPETNQSDAAESLNEEQLDAVLRDVKIPLGGDLLGRERITGARRTRLGCDLSSERFESLVENTALWHCKQSFLQFVWEKLYQSTPVSGKEIGSLYYFRQLFRLTNVTKKVKQNYASCESLMLSATNAHICAAFMEWAGLQNLDDVPKTITIPGSSSREKERKEFLENVLSKFVEEYVLVEFDREKALRKKNEEKASARQQEDELSGVNEASNLSTGKEGVIVEGQLVAMVDESKNVVAFGKATNLHCSNQNERNEQVDYIGVTVVNVKKTGIERNIAPNTCHMWPIGQIQKVVLQPPSNQSQQVPRPQSSLEPSDEEDRVMNYGLQMIQLGVLLMQLNDTEKEGDGDRALRNWKLLMLYFRARSRGMKYAYEAMRLITYTKALFSEKMAARILYGQFINIKGGKGNNVANDLKMEHLIKYNKVILHDLSGNKTLKAIQRHTKATYGLQRIAKEFDEQCKIKPGSTAHTHMSKMEDEKLMLAKLIQIRPFQYHSGRKSKAFPRVSKCLLEEVNPVALDEWLKKHKKRLGENPLIECDSDDHSDDEDISDEERNDNIQAYEIIEDNVEV